MSCTNCGSAFHEKWACTKPPKTPVSENGTYPVSRVVFSELEGDAVTLASFAPLPSADRRKADRHRPGYYADYMRKRRAAAKDAGK